MDFEQTFAIRGCYQPQFSHDEKSDQIRASIRVFQPKFGFEHCDISVQCYQL